MGGYTCTNTEDIHAHTHNHMQIGEVAEHRGCRVPFGSKTKSLQTEPLPPSEVILTKIVRKKNGDTSSDAIIIYTFLEN